MDTFKETEDYFQFIRPYQEAMDFLMVQIKILNEDYREKYRDYPIHNIQSRIKEKESIVEKLRRKELPQNFESARNHLTDIAGIRIICYFESDVYHVAEQIKKYSDMICIRESDYIKNPKPNGYKSYHIILGVPVYHTDSKEYYPVEVQIRSLTMDLWASMEHRIIYKGGNIDKIKSRKVFLDIWDQLQNCEDILYELKSENDKEAEEQ
mgnify:FL=1